MCWESWNYYISFRKLSELDKELFTVKISASGVDTLSIAQYVNRNDEDVLILKSASEYEEEALHAYIKKEDSWVEINTSS